MGKYLELKGLSYGVLAISLLILSQNSGIVAAQFQHPDQKYSEYPTQKQDRGLPPSPEVPRDIPSDENGSLQETGFYQAGPRTGAFQGASRGVGIGGGGITLPELKLKLPSIELPCFTRTRYSARMLYEGGEAPWVSTGFQAVGARGAAQGRNGSRSDEPTEARDLADQKPGSRGGDDCEDVRREYEDKIEKLNKKLESCDRLEQDLQNALRKHQAGFSRVPFTTGRDFGTVGEAARSLSTQSIPAGHFDVEPDMMGVPPKLSSRRTPSVRPANHWGEEPALLPLGTMMRRLPLPEPYPSASAGSVQYPSTGY